MSDSAHIRYEMQGDKMIVSYDGGINSRDILLLTEIMQQGIEKYFYSHIVLAINSSGGEAAALFYFISKIHELQDLLSEKDEELILETIATIQSCSAAAIMLSMGTIGHRKANADTFLVFHNARQSSGTVPSTGDKHQDIASSLHSLDQRMLLVLFQHIFPRVNPEIYSLLKSCCCLKDDGKKVDSEDGLHLLGLQEIDKLVGQLNAEETDHEIIQQQLTHEVEMRLKALRTQYGETITYDEICVGDQEKMCLKIIGWVYGQMGKYRTIFAEDRKLTVNEALDLRLIDSVQKRRSL